MANNVLVADDSLSMRSVIKKTIRATGIAVDEFYEAANGMIAGNTFANSNDQVVFDLGIPDIVPARDLENRTERGDVVINRSHTLEKCLFTRVLLKM